MFINTKFRIICEVNNIVRGQISENFNSDKYRSSIVCKFKCRCCEQVQQLKISKCIKIQMCKTRGKNRRRYGLVDLIMAIVKIVPQGMFMNVSRAITFTDRIR
jgi:hypothetical protein